MPHPHEAIEAVLTSWVSRRHPPHDMRDRSPEAVRVGLRALGLDPRMVSGRVIHIAGSKGKGSAAFLTECALRKTGYTTGLFTSPHLVTPRERIRINGRPISPMELLSAMDRVGAQITEVRWPDGGATPLWDSLSYFARLFLVACSVFWRHALDAWIIEVGIGGLYDATNVFDRPAVCAITSVELEHTAILGHAIADIAAQKSGIARPGTPIFVPTSPSVIPPEALRVVRAWADLLGSPVVGVHVQLRDGVAPPSPWVSRPRAGNAGLAAEMAKAWERRSDTSRTTDAVAPDPFDLAMKPIPGREQVVALRSGLTFYLDGAHTAESVGAAMEWFVQTIAREPRLRSPRKTGLILGVTGPRDLAQIAARLFRGFGASSVFHVIVFWKAGGQVLPACCASLPSVPTFFVETSTEALEIAVRQDLTHVFVTGSFYLVGDVLVDLGTQEGRSFVADWV